MGEVPLQAGRRELAREANAQLDRIEAFKPHFTAGAPRP